MNIPAPQPTEPKNVILDTYHRVLIIYDRLPMPEECFVPDRTVLRMYPEWTVLYMPKGVKLCCIEYQYVIINAYNIAIE